jgi:hypothetical protein
LTPRMQGAGGGGGGSGACWLGCPLSNAPRCWLLGVVCTKGLLHALGGGDGGGCDAHGLGCSPNDPPEFGCSSLCAPQSVESMISLGRSYRLHGDAKNSLRYLDMAIKVCDDDVHG